MPYWTRRAPRAAQRNAGRIDPFPLLAVPFFILAGNLMNSAGRPPCGSCGMMANVSITALLRGGVIPGAVTIFMMLYAIAAPASSTWDAIRRSAGRRWGSLSSRLSRRCHARDHHRRHHVRLVRADRVGAADVAAGGHADSETPWDCHGWSDRQVGQEICDIRLMAAGCLAPVILLPVENPRRTEPTVR